MKIRGLRWWIIGLIALATAINYVDRNALSLLWPTISKELGFTKGDYANIVSVFLIAYAISQTVSGWLYDKIGTRKGFVFSILTWSVGCILHGFAWTVRSFSVFRVILGFGEAGNWPGAAKSIAEWHPVKERATATGIFNSGAAIGAIVSMPLTAYLAISLGWRQTFIVLALAGTVWLIPWLLINRKKPSEHPYITDEEKKYILESKEQTVDNKPIVERENYTMLQLLLKRQTWGIMLSRFFLDPVWWLFLVWLPIYLDNTYGFNLKEMGLLAGIPYIGGGVGAVLGGKIAGIFIRKHFSVDRARKITITLGCILMFIPLVFIVMSNNPMVELSLGILVLFGFQSAMSNIQTLPSDFYQGNEIGKVMGFSGTMSTIGVIIGIKLVPLITSESFTPMFVMAAILVPLGLLSALFVGGKIEKVK